MEKACPERFRLISTGGGSGGWNDNGKGEWEDSARRMKPNEEGGGEEILHAQQNQSSKS